MHFYDIIYQHEDSAWLLQAILISLMNNRAKNWPLNIIKKNDLNV